MKKKILTAAVIVAVLALMVSTSLAYFTDQDAATNVFTVGSVRIEIYENDEATDEDVIEFGALTPVVNVADPSADVNYYNKVVDVKNIGVNDAYIRTHIAIPAALADYLVLDYGTLTGWTQQADSTATVDGVDYVVYTYDHAAAVEAGDFTAELLQGVYLAANVDVEEDADGNLLFILRDQNGVKTHASGYVAHVKNADGTWTSNVVNVLVASQAIQAEGFSDASSALNSGFAANPWA